MSSNLWSHVQNTNAFSYALLWRVVSQFYCLTSRYFGALSILTGKADAKKNLLEDEAPDPPSSSLLESTQSLDLPQYFNIHVRRMNTTNAAYHCIKY